MPLVNGASLAELATLKAGAAGAVLPGSTDMAVLSGFSTLSITWTTPLATRTLGTMTRAELTNRAPSMEVKLREPPLRVVTDELKI